ncbi:hypothetical protein D3C85_1030590 [compost metagenome]
MGVLSNEVINPRSVNGAFDQRGIYSVVADVEVVVIEVSTYRNFVELPFEVDWLSQQKRTSTRKGRGTVSGVLFQLPNDQTHSLIPIAW